MRHIKRSSLTREREIFKSARKTINGRDYYLASKGAKNQGLFSLAWELYNSYNEWERELKGYEQDRVSLSKKSLEREMQEVIEENKGYWLNRSQAIDPLQYLHPFLVNFRELCTDNVVLRNKNAFGGDRDAEDPRDLDLVSNELTYLLADENGVRKLMIALTGIGIDLNTKPFANFNPYTDKFDDLKFRRGIDKELYISFDDALRDDVIWIRRKKGKLMVVEDRVNEEFTQQHSEQDYHAYIDYFVNRFLFGNATEENNNSQQLEKIVGNAVDILFTGDEKERVQRKIAEAQIRMRKSWASVPRLNLGPINLPTPGQKDITTDEFVVNAAPYVVESLHTLGIMNYDEAEQVVARQLTNYLVHRGGFQLSRISANKILTQLKNQDTKKISEVA